MTNPVEPSDDATYAAEMLPLVREASAAWLAGWRAELARDGRPMEGGWPGTLGEARAFVLGRITSELVRKGLPHPTPNRTARAVRDLYDVTRRAWQSAAASER